MTLKKNEKQYGKPKLSCQNFINNYERNLEHPPKMDSLCKEDLQLMLKKLEK
jgi:hypothetical protein